MNSLIAKPIKRIITCQGSIQLVTALSVLQHREQHSDPLAEYENYLVIYDLNAPAGQGESFREFIQQMARHLYEWKAIVYLTPEDMSEIAAQLRSTAPRKLFAHVHQLVGTDQAAEIYLCRNWQFGNQLLLNAYQDAVKICYGDGIGLYFSATSPAFFAPKPEPQITISRSLVGQIETVVQGLKMQGMKWGSQLRTKLGLKTVLHSLPFDIGYFVLPEVMGEAPPMPVTRLTTQPLLKVFQQLKDLACPDDIAHVQTTIAQHSVHGIKAPVSILLTSNLSEANRLSQAEEIDAYCQFLVAQGIQPGTVLVIKPHPRDNLMKIQNLKEHLTELFSQVIVLTKPHLFFLPFEIFFLATFLGDDLRLKNPVRVFAVSSACLSFQLLFNVPTVLGFGDQLTQQIFDEAYASTRLLHDRLLQNALDSIKPSTLVTHH